MKTNFKKWVLIGSIITILIVGLILGVYKLFKDENSLTILEKTWIDNNKNSVYTINIPNDINIFGKKGSGVYFDFIEDLDEDLNLKLNTSVYSISNKNDSFGFSVGNTYDNRDLLLFTDYYVLVSKDNSSFCNIDNVTGTIGILGNDLTYVSNYYKLNATINNYDNSDKLFESLKNGEVNYIIVPLTQYKDKIISNYYNICYFFNDAKVYYYLHLSNEKTLNSIVTKFYNKWIVEEFKESYNENNYELFIDSLAISDIDEDALTDKNYNFMYLVNQPYQLLSRGVFNGIVSTYLSLFNEFSDIEFNYNKVKNFNDLKNNVEKEKIDLFFNQYNYENKYKNININLNLDYYIISNRDVKLNIDSLKAYNGTLYVEENSLLFNYLSSYKNITIKTYNKSKHIKKLVKKNNIVIVDKYSYDNYLIDSLNNVHILLEGVSNKTYTFEYKNDSDIFYRLFSTYVNTLNPKEVIDSSLDVYFKNYEAGNKTVKLAKYIIIFIITLLVSVYLLIRSKKRIVLNTKVKNNEKIRYVDMLTSLKNRNYLNDRMEVWNQNTIYPQAVIVLDLNNVKYLNDTFGHEEGDKQIKSAANALFKTQLENSELIRTDGNEFMIYLVGYTEKQVVNYIKKLLKEFKKLPYEYGVAIGFSMIKDDLKLVEDAFNEAMLMMRKNKNSFEGNDDK